VILDDFPPHLFVTEVCVIGWPRILIYTHTHTHIHTYIHIHTCQRGCAVKITLEAVFCILFLLEELVLEV